MSFPFVNVISNITLAAKHGPLDAHFLRQSYDSRQQLFGPRRLTFYHDSMRADYQIFRPVARLSAFRLSV